MIELNVEGYCQSCPYFEPDVSNPDIAYGGDGSMVCMGNTHIFCTHRNICGRLYDYCKEDK